MNVTDPVKKSVRNKLIFQNVVSRNQPVFLIFAVSGYANAAQLITAQLITAQFNCRAIYYRVIYYRNFITAHYNTMRFGNFYF